MQGAGSNVGAMHACVREGPGTFLGNAGRWRTPTRSP